MIVGVTGGIATGKSTVCSIFAELGVPTTSADILAKEIIDTDLTIQKKIIEKFTHAIIMPDHKIDRQKLRTLIFNSKPDRMWLEALLHPIIMQKIAEYAANVTYPYCVVEIPLLLESNLQKAVDQVLIIDSPEDLQLARASRRDNISNHDIQQIIDIQLTREERLNTNYHILENSSDIESLRNRVKILHEQYLALANAKNN